MQPHTTIVGWASTIIKFFQMRRSRIDPRPAISQIPFKNPFDLGTISYEKSDESHIDLVVFSQKFRTALSFACFHCESKLRDLKFHSFRLRTELVGWNFLLLVHLSRCPERVKSW